MTAGLRPQWVSRATSTSIGPKFWALTLRISGKLRILILDQSAICRIVLSCDYKRNYFLILGDLPQWLMIDHSTVLARTIYKYYKPSDYSLKFQGQTSLHALLSSFLLLQWEDSGTRSPPCIALARHSYWWNCQDLQNAADLSLGLASFFPPVKERLDMKSI